MQQRTGDFYVPSASALRVLLLTSVSFAHSPPLRITVKVQPAGPSSSDIQLANR